MDHSRSARLEAILPMLACPRCHGRLVRGGDLLRCGGCSRRYPIVEGRPAFLPGEGEIPKLMPPEKISHELVPSVVHMLECVPGWSLNIGAGGTPRGIERSIELEYAIFRNTDVASDAHALPFGDATFDAVVSFNTFEHLADPGRAAAEIYRVLKPGGRVLVQTAFLQPLHEAPYHYYNATEFGLRQWFAAFDDPEVTIPKNFHPAHVLGWIVNRALETAEEAQGEEARDVLAAMTLGQWAKMWNEPQFRECPEFRGLGELPDHMQKEFCAGYQITANRPVETASRSRFYRPAFRRLARWWAESSSTR